MTASSGSKRAIVGVMVGFLYGSILAFLSLGAAGAGHGTIIPLFLSSAPLGVFWDTGGGREAAFLAMLFGGPFLWAALGSLVALSGRGKGLRRTQILVLLHYASGLALVAATDSGLPDLPADLKRAPELVIMWATVYLAGQVALWWQMSKRGQLRPTVCDPPISGISTSRHFVGLRNSVAIEGGTRTSADNPVRT